jgi:hypothetical protein
MDIWDLKRKEGICDDTYRAEKDGARRDFVGKGSAAETVGRLTSAAAGSLGGARWGGGGTGRTGNYRVRVG